MIKLNRWIVLFWGIIISLGLLIFIPEEYLIFRTLSITAVAVISIGYYLYRRYHLNLTVQADLLISFNTLLQFLLPVFYLVFYFTNNPLLDRHGYRFSYPVTSFTALLGQTMFFAGYETVKGSLYFPKIKVTQNLSTFFITFAPFILIVWGARIILLATGTYYNLYRSDFQFNNPYYSVLSLLELFGLIIIAALFLIAFSDDGHKSRIKKMVIAVVFIVAEIIWYLPSGRRDPLANIILTPVLAYIFICGKMPKKTIVILSVLGVLVLTVLGYVRYVIPQFVYSQTEISLTAIPDILSASVTEVKKQKVDIIGETMDRVYDGKSLGYLLTHYTSDYDYEFGISYTRIPYIFLPRFIYHDKPVFATPLGNWYQLLAGGSQPTTFWGESYINFSWAGIIIISFIWGWLMKWYDFLFMTQAHKPFWIYMYIFSAILIFRLPVEAAVVWISYLSKFIAMAFIFSIFSDCLLMVTKKDISVDLL